jgi:hypothetical protein
MFLRNWHIVCIFSENKIVWLRLILIGYDFDQLFLLNI